VFWVISVYFNIRNTLPKFCPFLLGHPVYRWTCLHKINTETITNALIIDTIYYISGIAQPVVEAP